MSNIIIENNLNYNIGEDIVEIIKNCVNASAENEKCPYEFEVSVTITDNEEIKKINNEFRNIAKETDVLSFPLIDYSNPSDFSAITSEDIDLFNLDTEELILGDIIISFDKAKAQALDYGHSIEREIGFLTIHSMLHLFGYDHMTNEDETLMISKQKEILEKVGLKR
jgi:probable rRNA maturation factor